MDISGKLPAIQVAALRELKRTTDGLGIDFFIIGATARDILIEHMNGIPAPRMTRDVDIAVCVTGWGEFRRLTDAMLASGVFLQGDREQRFVSGDIIIDIIPFGGIAGRDNQIFWLPEYDIRMSTVGFMDVHDSSIICRLNDDPILDIGIASLPGLMVLKLLSWHERYPERGKDAQDLIFMIRKYQFPGIIDRLYEEAGEGSGLLIEEAFDHGRACARLLGRDMARISGPETANAVLKILASELRSDGQYGLVAQMTSPGEDSVEIILLLEKLEMGFRETAKSNSGRLGSAG